MNFFEFVQTSKLVALKKLNNNPLLISSQLLQAIIKQKIYPNERDIQFVEDGFNVSLAVECHICNRRVHELSVYVVCKICQEIICKGCSIRCDWCHEEFCHACNDPETEKLVRRLTRNETDHYRLFTTFLYNKNEELKNRLVHATVCLTCEPI